MQVEMLHDSIKSKEPYFKISRDNLIYAFDYLSPKYLELILDTKCVSMAHKIWRPTKNYMKCI